MQAEGEEVGGEASDWEYEYDGNETESFFVTLDFTTHALPNPRKRKHNDDNDTSGDAQRPSEAPTDGTPALNDETPAPGDETPAPLDRTRAPTTKPSAPASSQITDSPPKCLQFLDLATSNPLISYKKELYTCDWASAVGTDVFLSGPRPAVSEAASEALSPTAPSGPPLSAPTPLSTRPGYNILGLSSLRLVAKPAQLAARSTSIPVPTPQSSVASASASAPIADPAIPTTAPASQHTFLTRLSAIKAARGDTDTVPLTPSHVDFSRTPLPVPSLDALRSVPVTPKTSTPRTRGPGRGRGRGRGRGSRGGRGGAANVEGEAEGQGGDANETEEPETPVGPKPRRKREGPGRWGSGRGRGSRVRGSSSTRGRLWTWNGAGGGEGAEGERSEVVVDPRLEDVGVGVGVDGVVDGAVVPEARTGAGEEARPSDGEGNENVPRLPNENVVAVTDQPTTVQGTGNQPSMPQTAPTTEEHANGA